MKEKINLLKKLNREINEVICELKQNCLEVKVQQFMNDKIELSVFKRII